MQKIGIIGASGYVGRAVARRASELEGYSVEAITRSNFSSKKAVHYDILIHSAMPSKRWWALNNRAEDFQASVGLTSEIAYNWSYGKLALISSVSSRVQLDHPYGLHKSLAEQVVLASGDKNLVIRLGGLFGSGLDKGVVYDLFQGNEIFLSSESSFNYIDTDDAAKLIVNRLGQSGTIEVGAKDTVSIGEIARKYNLEVEFGSRYEVQDTANPEADYPESRNIYTFIDNVINKI